MSEFDYTGKENLDAMALAVRYNNTIYDWLRRDLADSDRLLEFGAGKGEYCNRFQSAGRHIQAVELDEQMHQVIACQAHARLADAESGDGDDNNFDLIYAVNVLEHIADDVTTVREFHKRLQPGGRVKIFVPARQELFSNMDRLVGHERRYHPANLRKLFSENGFTVRSCRYFDLLGYFATLVYKLTGGKGEVSPGSIRIYDALIFPLSRLADLLTGGRLIGKNLILEAVKNA